MQTIPIEAQERELLSRGELNKMRMSGWIPAVLYRSGKKARDRAADGTGSKLLKVEEKLFLKTLGAQKTSNVIFEVKCGKESVPAVVKEMQRHLITRKMLHVDFQGINLAEKLEVMVPIRIAGEAPGVKNSGGILEHITRELKILCLPKDIPAEITADVSALEIGQGLFVKDLKEIAGARVLSDPNLLVANIVAPTILEEAIAITAAASTEPEVIAKGKKPEEEGEAAAAAPAKSKEGTPAAGAKPAETKPAK